jgi:hypothetical protein
VLKLCWAAEAAGYRRARDRTAGLGLDSGPVE